MVVVKVRFENLWEHLLLLQVFETGVYQSRGLVGEASPKSDGLRREPMAYPGKVLRVKGAS